MTDIHARLRKARSDAGFDKATDAAEAFGWTYSTYAGHENGNRGIKPPDVEKYADAFGVDSAWLQTGRHAAQQKPAAPEPDHSGMAENLSRYNAPTDTLRQELRRLAETVAPTARNTTYLIAHDAHPGVMIAAGDVLLVNLDDHRAAPGAVVVCSVTDEQTGDGRTEVRVQTAAGPIAAFGDAPLGSTEIETIFGTVVTVLRGIPNTQVAARQR